ncbi:hypothetical protein K488DRAFT_92346 [Vararia minispora EC-137]|uniref:Uncharacterized protein n=1 Tax=Vararia minispora EC-137 TaxID=1314806 RepID=A0ACB8Q461_9AGAM|nr:hypothetical protein K488DRAFT_92346 [Vararia minispora EC-137]
MSRESIAEWIALTRRTAASLELRRLSGEGCDESLAAGIDVALSLLYPFRTALKAGKNASQKNCAARVPKEVFERILKFAMTQAPIAVRRGGVADLGWVKLSQVCRAWRRFALSHEKAWASSVGQLPRATTVFQERAGSTPIDVIITGDRPLLFSQPQAFSTADEHSVGIILEDLNLALVRSLRLADGRACVFPYAKRLGAQGPHTLTRLTHLVLEDFSWNVTQEQAQYLASGRCRLKAYNLKTLRFKNCFMSLHCWAVTSVDIEYDGSLLSRPRASTFATALLGCRALNFLRLRDCLCPDVFVDHWQSDDIDKTELPALKYLSVSGPAHSLEELLVLLWFPPETVVHLDASVSPVGAPDIVRLLARACHGYLSARSFVSVTIDHDIRFSQHISRVRMWREAGLVELLPIIRLGASAKGLDPSPHFDLTVRDSENGRWPTVVNCFTRKLNSDSVKTLALVLPSAEYSAEAVRNWIDILDRFPKLAVLFPKHRVLLFGRRGGLVDVYAGVAETVRTHYAASARRIHGSAGPAHGYKPMPLPGGVPLRSTRTCRSVSTIPGLSFLVRQQFIYRSQAVSMPNAIVIYPNEPVSNRGPALASRDTVAGLMNVLDLPCDDCGRISDEAIANFLACDARQICTFFDPKRTVYDWHYSMYAGSSGTVNDVASIVRKDRNNWIRGPAVVVKDTPRHLWERLDTSVAVAELAASLWSYHKTGVDAAQVYGERALIRWLGTT